MVFTFRLGHGPSHLGRADALARSTARSAIVRLARFLDDPYLATRTEHQA
jgi:hypothetical protein